MASVSTESVVKYHGTYYGTGKVVCLTEADILTVYVSGKSHGACHLDDVLVSVDKKMSDVGKQQAKKGHIIHVEKTNRKKFCGKVLKETSVGVVIVPVDHKFPNVLLVGVSAAEIRNQWVGVCVERWNPKEMRFEGKVADQLGSIGERMAENRALMFGLPDKIFPASVVAELSSVPRNLTPDFLRNRCDLRSLPICSVDPPGCKDIDDAIHCIVLPNGNIQLGISIADVSAYVEPGTAVDIEAASRGTSVYLADQVINMLPDTLSEDLCSLQANEVRPAFTALCELSRDGVTVDCEFKKSLIKSRGSLTYGEAQSMIDAGAEDEVTSSLILLRDISHQLRKNRIKNGALMLNSTEIAFIFDASSRPSKIISKPVYDTYSLVEEAMIVANIAAANKLFSTFPDSVLVRCHPEPGVALDVSSTQHIMESLTALDDQPLLRSAICSEIARRLSKSYYGCSGYRTSADLLHYGLSVPLYCYFTSPIRRYSDVITHRMLAAAIGSDNHSQELFDKQSIERLCLSLNERESGAKSAERASRMLFMQIVAMDARIRDQAIITCLSTGFVTVRTQEFGICGTINVPIDQNNKAFKIELNEQKSMLKIGNEQLLVSQLVVVELAPRKLNPYEQSLPMLLIEPRLAFFNNRKRTAASKESESESESEYDSAAGSLEKLLASTSKDATSGSSGSK